MATFVNYACESFIKLCSGNKIQEATPVFKSVIICLSLLLNQAFEFLIKPEIELCGCVIQLIVCCVAQD